jgi:hypothetical protein
MRENKTMQDKISMTREQFDELDRLFLKASKCVGDVFETVKPKLILHVKAKDTFIKIGKLLKEIKEEGVENG